MSEKIDSRIETALLAAAAGSTLLAVTGTILYDYTINRNRKSTFGPKIWKDEDLVSGVFTRTDIYEEALAWAEKTPIAQFSTVAFDGISLSAFGFEQKKQSKRWLIAVPGYTKTAASLFPVAQAFYREGFNTLLLEPRASGRSGGNAFGMGWLDRLDVMKWIQQITNGTSKAEIVLYGVGTGANAVIMAAGEDLPSNVRCIISDSAYSTLTELANYTIKRSGAPCFPLNLAASWVTKIRAGYTFNEASAVDQVSKSKTPILFIHGGKDDRIPSEMVYELFNAANCVKDLFVVPQATYAFSMYANYEEYWKKVNTFIERFVSPKNSERSTTGMIKDGFNRIRGK